jgi:putative sugar O-methyltransferase
MKQKFKNIIKSFSLSIKNYELNIKSKHWKKRFEEKKKFLRFKYLKNFRNNSLSDGLDNRVGSIESQKKIFNQLKDLINENYLLENLDSKNVGKLKNCFKLKNKYLDPNTMFHIHCLSLIEKNLKKIGIKKTEVNTICEIGAGYGSLSRLLLNNFKNSKLIIIDLPETNFINSYYLIKNFPNKKFLLYSEITNEKLSINQIINYDVIIIPPWVTIKSKIDIFINIRSFMEMNKKTIKKYFELIQDKSIKTKLLININRYEKNTVGENIRLNEYPYDNNWRVLHSNPTWNHSNVHTLITQRINNSGDIFNELVKINKLRILNNFKVNKHFIKKLLPKKLFLFIQKFKHNFF